MKQRLKHKSKTCMIDIRNGRNGMMNSIDNIYGIMNFLMNKNINNNMYRKIIMSALFLCTAILTSCTDLIFDDRSGCDRGVFVNFKYDYNLQHSDMFADHVGEVTVYVFDENGRYVTSQIEGNEEGNTPLKDDDYSMFFDLPVGKYQFVAYGMQRKYSDLLLEEGAKFTRSEYLDNEDFFMEDLKTELSNRVSENDGKVYIDHKNLPLDTLWHSKSDALVEVVQGKYVYHTLSLVRNTKTISVVLRDIENPEAMDINDYEMCIEGANVILNHDNTPDNSVRAICTPYVSWNTQDPDLKGRSGVGNMGHADFMTSRIVFHESLADDERLVVKSKKTGKVVIEVNLPDLLSRLSSYDEMHRYTKQEFLDRGYDYDLTFFLSGGSWAYANVSIGVLGWSVRVQNVEL